MDVSLAGFEPECFFDTENTLLNTENTDDVLYNNNILNRCI